MEYLYSNIEFNVINTQNGHCHRFSAEINDCTLIFFKSNWFISKFNEIADIMYQNSAVPKALLGKF